MDDRSARIAMLLGVPPLGVGVFVVGGSVFDDLHWEPPLRWAVFAATFTMCVCVLLIWRRYVRWNRIRSSVSLGLTVLLLGQVLIWQPLWSMPGCADEDVLRVAQSLTMAGLWCVGCALSWWGMTLLRRRNRIPLILNPDVTTEKPTMSPGSARLAIGIAYAPLLPGIFFMTGMALDHFLGMSETLGIAIGYQLCAVIIVATWVPLWRRAVQWTAKRRKMTVLYAAALLLAPWSVYLPRGPEVWNVFCWILPLWVAAIWFVGTALAWRTRRDFDIERLASCPKCEYSLRGLSEIRCPECGWNSTVDDIVGCCMAAAADFD